MATVAPAEERKVITVLFADLAGFTSHTERSDPEDVRARLSTYHRRVREDVERFGGRIEKLMGDGVFAVFGAPVAHEDDRERAVRSALRIQESVAALNESDAALELSVRIGVTTGEAIVQLDASALDREGIIGDVVNTASRLEGVAKAGTVVVDERTYRGATSAIEFEELPPVMVKGKVEPVAIWRAVAPRSRLGTSLEDQHTTPFLGRDPELGQITAAFDRTVREGSVQLVTITGEPGVGKSRLLHEFRVVIDNRPDLVFWRQGRCLPYGEGITFWAVGEIIKAQAGVLDSDDHAATVDKLEQTVGALIDDPSTAAWTVSQLEPLAGVGRTETQGSSQELFGALTRFFEALAVRNPLVLVIEDLQWADPSLLEFVNHLAEWATDSPILVVGTARPELLTAHPDWGGGKRNATTIGLSPLTDDDTARIIGSLLDRSVLDAKVQRSLLDRCGGNPLYATEFVRYVSDRGLLDQLAAGVEIPMPDTIHGLIAARVDLLAGDEKALLQAASVVGRVFWTGVVSEAMGQKSDEIRQRLRKLATRELIRPVRRSSMAGQEEWSFVHALITDVAYGQIPRSERIRLHRAVATWIDQASGERVAEVAELLAYHYGKILELQPAAVDPELQRRIYAAMMASGMRVAAVDARKAGSYYDQAVILAATPADRALARLERGELYTNFDSVDAAEADLVAGRAEAQEAADLELEARALFMLSSNHWYRGDAPGRRRFLDEAFALVGERPDSEMAARLIVTRAFDSWVDGDSATTLDIIDAGRATVLAAGSPNDRARLIETEGGARLALGDPSGLELMRTALDMAIDLNQTPRVNSSYNNLATNALFDWPVAEVLALIEQAIQICEERGFRPHADWSRMTRVESLFPLGRWDEAVKDLERLLEDDLSRGGSIVAAYSRAWLALFNHYRGRPSVARGHFDASIEQVLGASDALANGAALAIGILISQAGGDRGGVAKYADELGERLGEADSLLDYYTGLVADELVAAGQVDRLEALVGRARAGRPWGKARLQHAQGVLAEAQGDHQAAVDLALGSIRVLEPLGHVFDPTRSRILAGRNLIHLDRAEEAVPLLERAIADAEQMGAQLLVNAARDILDEAGQRQAAGS